MKEPKQDPQLEEQLKAAVAAGRNMTKAEVREQRISFVYGQLPATSTMTRDQVATLLDKMGGRDPS